MERPLDQAVRSVERALRIATRDPFFVRRLQAAASAKDNRTHIDDVKSRLEYPAARPVDALTVDLSESQPKVSIYQTGINRQGQKIGIQLTLTLESRQ